MSPEGLKIATGDVPAAQPKQPPVSKPPVKSEAARSPEQEETTQLQKKLDPDVIEKITQELNDQFRIFNTAVSFSVDDKTGTTVIKILDRETEKVIREIPSSELLKIASKLTEIIGRLVDETV